MIAENPFRNEKADALITELGRASSQMERLLRQLPTTDVTVLGELHTLSTRIVRMVSEDPGRERNAMFLDQAKRKALFQRQRYLRIALAGTLRNA
jgi:hypothetical protein